jgi:hypothetical protein
VRDPGGPGGPDDGDAEDVDRDAGDDEDPSATTMSSLTASPAALLPKLITLPLRCVTLVVVPHAI